MLARGRVICVCGMLLATPLSAAGRGSRDGSAAAPATAASATLPDAAFDALVSEAKGSMLAAPERALTVARRALAYAAGLPDGRQKRLERATGQWLAGEALSRLNQPGESAKSIDAGLAVVERDAPASKLRGDLLMSRGQIGVNAGQVQRALTDFQNAFKIFQSLGERRSEAVALQNIGMIYSLAGDQQRVLRYYEQSAETYSGDPALALSAHNNKGLALRQLGRFAESEAEYRQALALARSMRSPSLEARVLNNLAVAQLLIGQPDRADATADAGLKVVAGDEEAREWLPFLWGVKAQVAYQRRDLAGASAFLDRTFAGSDLTETGPVYRDFHETAQKVYMALGDDKRALAHLAALKRLDDETRELRASTNAALMAAQFDYSNQELRISRLKTGQLQRDVLLAKSQARLRTIVLSAVLALLMLVLAAYFSIRRSRNQTRAANRELSHTNIALEKALKAKSEFLATTSHEIRTPLNGILGMTQVLLRDPRLDHEARDRVQVVQGAGEMMKAVVDDILDMAKIESGRIEIEQEEVPLKGLLRDVGGLWIDQARAKGVRVDIAVDQAPERIVEDGRRLRQVVFNLMSNATKFTESGDVRLSAFARPAGDGEELVIQVFDTGIGIAAEHQEAIFEPFRQVDGGTSRKFGGTGLGLAISRNLVTAMGGTLTVESTLDVGSTFTVVLPLVRVERSAEVRPEGAGRPATLDEAAALLIEPNPLFQSIARAALDGDLARIELAADVSGALALLAEARFDIVAVDGAALAGDTEPLRALRRACGDAPLVVLVADPGAVDQAALRAAGADRIAPKSFPPIDLAAILAEALGAPAAAPSPDAGKIAA